MELALIDESTSSVLTGVEAAIKVFVDFASSHTAAAAAAAAAAAGSQRGGGPGSLRAPRAVVANPDRCTLIKDHPEVKGDTGERPGAPDALR